MAGATVQVLLQTDLTDEDYVSQRVWNLATAPPCPWCRPSTCRLRSHGTYPRQRPAGAQVRRFLCLQSGKTVSLLPSCLASHVSGSLESIEQAVRRCAQAPSLEQAADRARPAQECSLASAQRWLRRRLDWVRQLLTLVKGLYPERFAGAEPTLQGFERQLGSRHVLRELRTVAAAHLPDLPTPVGLRHRRRKSSAVTAAARSAETQTTGLAVPAVAA